MGKNPVKQRAEQGSLHVPLTSELTYRTFMALYIANFLEALHKLESKTENNLRDCPNIVSIPTMKKRQCKKFLSTLQKCHTVHMISTVDKTYKTAYRMGQDRMGSAK